MKAKLFHVLVQVQFMGGFKINNLNTIALNNKFKTENYIKNAFSHKVQENPNFYSIVLIGINKICNSFYKDTSFKHRCIPGPIKKSRLA
jgi:hypothetical protein